MDAKSSSSSMIVNNGRIARNCRNNRSCFMPKYLKSKYNNQFYHQQNNINNINNNNRIILTRSQSSRINCNHNNNNVNNNVKNKQQYNNINNICNNINNNAKLNGFQKSFSAVDSVVIYDEQSAIKLTGCWAKEVYNWVLCRQLENKLNNIPADSIIPLLNDMQLYPSPAQVFKMVQRAKQCSRPNARDDFLTFGELCVFVRALKSSQLSSSSQSNITSTSSSGTATSTSSPSPINNCQNGNQTKCEVFLGGSCNPTTWRADIAIPELQRNGISFYNPQVSMWAPELVAQEHDAKQAASVLLFVIDSQTRSTVGMIEVAYLVASGRCVVVVVQPYQAGQMIMGETITDREFHDLVSCQKALLSLVRSKDVRIHRNLSTALDCTAKILGKSPPTSPSPDEILRRLREDYDAFGGDINNLLNSGSDKLSMNGICNHIRSLNGNITSSRLSFNHYCTLMSEFNAINGGGCKAECNSASAQDGWANSYQRQHSANNNSNHHITPSVVQNGTFQIFLGGSISTNIKWRQQIAIPLLKQHGLSYYNPAIRETIDNNNCTMDVEENDNNHDENNGVCEEERQIRQWKEIMDRSEVLLFVITNDTRSMTSLVLAAHYIGLKRKVVLSIEHLPDDCSIANETLSRNAIKDYNRARVYVADLAQRNNLPVFNNIQEAVESAIITLNL